MKKLIIFLALCLSAFVQSFAVGEEFKVGDLYYKITSNVEPYTVEVYDGPDRASVTIPETVTNKGITYSVTSIGDWAFSQSILQSVVIPNSVTSIGERAFEYCSNLQSVVIPNSVTSIGEGAFASCELLESVVIPNSVTSIGDDAFFSCLINMMVIPNSITSIGDWGSVFIMNLFLKSETPQYPFEADCIYVPCGSIKNYRNYKYADYERMYQEGRLIEYEYLLIGISDGNSYVEITQHPTCQNNQAEIKAIPSLGYAFSQWSDGSTDNPYKLTLISDSTLSASFEYVGVSNVTLAKDDNSGVGGVTGGGSFTNGTQTVIKANSGEGYAFSHWNDGNTDNPRTITVTQDTTFTAYFFEKEFFSDNGITYAVTSNVEPYTVEVVVGPDRALVTIPETVTNKGITYSVTSIGESAFSYCLSLQSVVIPNSVTSIGELAFWGCPFLQSVIIPNSVTSIGDGAFSDCSLQSVVIPNSVTSIGDGAFSGCAFLQSVIIPNSITSIGEWAFSDCHSLRSVVIPNSVTSIGFQAFGGCSSLQSVVIPNSVTSIGDNAFQPIQGNLYLKSETPQYPFEADYIYVPCGIITNYRNYSPNYELMYQDGRLIEYESLLIGISDGNGNVEITQHPTCQNNQAIIKAVPDNRWGFIRWNDGNTENPRAITVTQDTTFTAYFFEKEFFSDNGITYAVTSNAEPYTVEVYKGPDRASVTIPETVTYNSITYSVTSISDMAFFDCFSLQSVVIPNSVTSIGGRAFAGCNILQSVVIPNSVTSISDMAFAGCSSLQSVVIPNSVTSIGVWAFSGCPPLQSVVIPNSVTSIGDRAFDMIFNLFLRSETPQYPFEADYIYVPCGSITNYRNYSNADYESMYQKGRLIEYEYLLAGLPNDNGMVEITQQTTCQNNQAEIKAIPSPGYAFSHWSDGSTANPYKLTLISDSTLSASFEYVGFSTVTLAKDDNSGIGSVTGGGSFTNGSQTVIQANPGIGYMFSHWNDGNTENPRTITVTQDTSFTAYFAIKEYSVELWPVGNGKVTGVGKYVEGSRISISAVPDDGNHFVSWSDGSKEAERSIYIDRNYAIAAQFASNDFEYTLTANATEGGTVTGGGSYKYGTDVELLAVADDGYHFTGWEDLLNGGDKFDPKENDGKISPIDPMVNPRSVIVTKDMSFTARFESDGIFDVKVWVSGKGTVQGAGQYRYGTNATLEAVPDVNWRFVKWSDGAVEPSRTLLVENETMLIAVFEYDSSFVATTVTTSVNDTLRGHVTGGGIFNRNSEVTLEAVANYGYQFAKWSDGDATNPRMVTVTSDTAFTAEFTEAEFTLSLSSDSTGTVAGSGKFAFNTVATITATPSANYHFVRWSDGDTLAVRTIKVMSDTSLVALFGAHVAVVDSAISTTCVSQGMTEGSHCSVCGKVLKARTYISAYGHDNPEEYTIDALPTCTTPGSKSKHCKRCGGLTDYVILEALGHDIVTDMAVMATCVDSGMTVGMHCSVCGTVFARQKPVAPLGHDFVATFTTDQQPTCTEEGSKSRHCSRCNEKTDITAMAALGHSWGEYIYNNDATTEADGTATATCLRQGCGETDTHIAQGTKLETGISDDESVAVNIYAHNMAIVVENANADVCVYDITGRMIQHHKPTGDIVELPMSEQGIYIVKVGSATNRVILQ